ncbi:MAG TPA: ABC transporter permease subunit [Puia sp.]|nr:ABC transporter permease subunit [Puia sp.]
MNKIVKYVILDILRNRIVLAYTFFLLIISVSAFTLEDNATKGMLTLLHVILIIVPLISLIFATIYMYNTAEFIELMVCQPLRRTRLLLSLSAGLALSLMLAFLVGAAVPILLFNWSAAAWTMILVGEVLTLVFVALAVLAAVITRDKAKGIGVALLLWFYFALIYDGIILFLLFQFSDYPMEKATIAFSSLNPVDLGRIMILLKLDISAMMGYTGAVFKDFFGSGLGMSYALLMLALWIALPLIMAVRRFNRKDL